MMKMRILVLAAVLTGAGLWRAAGAAETAETYPGATVRLLIPYGAGGPNDTIGRLLAQKLSELWGKPMVAENRPGAGANIGMAALAKSPPDGYTLAILGSLAVTVNPSLYRSMPVNPLTDLAPIIRFASIPVFMVVSPTFPARTVAEFITLAKNSPKQLNVCSMGPGTGPTIASELFKQLAGISMVDINYRAEPQCYISVMSGETAVYFPSPLVLTLVKANKLVALAVTAPSRVATAPEVPTMGEAGLPGAELSVWYGIYGPARLAPALQTKLRADIGAIIARPEVRAHLVGLGYEIDNMGPEEMVRVIRSETERWGKIVRAAKWSAD